jgi:5'-3' exonuclease
LTSTILSKKSLVKFNETFNLTKLSKTQEILLVVDAYALLYFSITNSGMDWINGGEYEVFAKFFHEYLTIFQTNSIKLIMVFDGLYENHKLDTLISRQVDNIKNNESISNTFPDSFVTSKKIRNPFGLETVAIDVMNKFENITVVISPMEADPFMAKLAQEHDAFGVVTNDSDFMVKKIKKKLNLKIYDTNGMIPCETIQITEKKEILVSKKTPKSIAQQLQIPCESDSHKTVRKNRKLILQVVTIVGMPLRKRLHSSRRLETCS